MKLHKYRLWCSTDSKWEYVWAADDDAVPSVCPTNGAHTIDTNLTAVVETLSDALPVQTQADGGDAVKIDPLQHPPGWTFLSLGFLAIIPNASPADVGVVSYHRINTDAGAAMALRAWTGKMVSQGCDIRDNMKVELVIKGSALGGVDGTHDVILDQFVRDMHPVDLVIREFTPPDKSMLIPIDAHDLNPALPPNTDIHFRITYTPHADTTADQYVTFDLEGFEPPAG